VTNTSLHTYFNGFLTVCEFQHKIKEQIVRQLMKIPLAGWLSSRSSQRRIFRTGYFETGDFYGDFEEFKAAEEEVTSESKYFIEESLGFNEEDHEMCIITLI
jgi:hypothetical protein